MPVRRLDHVNLRVAEVAATVDFYSRLLGMAVQVPPGAGDCSLAAWICDEAGRPVVRAVSASMRTATSPGTAPAMGAGAIHHVAFDCSNRTAMLDRLVAGGVAYTVNHVAGIDLQQIFVTDPNGILIELNFR